MFFNSMFQYINLYHPPSTVASSNIIFQRDSTQSLIFYGLIAGAPSVTAGAADTAAGASAAAAVVVVADDDVDDAADEGGEDEDDVAECVIGNG